LYQSPIAPFDAIDTVALRSTIESLGVTVRAVRAEAGQFARLICDGVEILVIGCNIPFATDHFRGATRPRGTAGGQARVLSLLAAHRSSLTVLVLDQPTGQVAMPISDTLKQQLCFETVDLLMATTAPDLVFWVDEDQLMTATEAEDALDSDLLDGLDLADTANATPMPVLAEIASAAPGFAVVPPLRPGDIALPAPDVIASLAYGPSANASASNRKAHLFGEPQLSPEIRDWFADTARTDADQFTSSDIEVLRAFLALDTSPDVKRMAETATGRASLYLMSATIAVFALPVGASMLTYNALSGGSFRATAHMMALTGIGLALTGMGLPSPAAALGF